MSYYFNFVVYSVNDYVCYHHFRIVFRVYYHFIRVIAPIIINTQYVITVVLKYKGKFKIKRFCNIVFRITYGNGFFSYGLIIVFKNCSRYNIRRIVIIMSSYYKVVGSKFFIYVNYVIFIFRCNFNNFFFNDRYYDFISQSTERYRNSFVSRRCGFKSAHFIIGFDLYNIFSMFFFISCRKNNIISI